MPKRILKKVKRGYVRANSIYKRLTTGAQVKIGSKRYKELVAKRKDTREYYSNDKYARLTKAYDITLPMLHRKPKFSTIQRLFRRQYVFSEGDRKQVYDTLRDISQMDKKMIRFKLNDGSTEFISLKDRGLGSITNAITSGYFGTGDAGFGSDTINNISTTGIKSISIQDVKKKNLFKAGRFFNYLNTTDLNLEKYQIISKQSNKDILSDHCLTYALSFADVSLELRNRIKSKFDDETHFQKKYLYQVADMIEKQIVLSFYDCKLNKKRMTKYGKKYNEVINLALFEEHYFINDTTTFTKYASANYADIKDVENYNDIYQKQKTGGYQKSNKKPRVDALTLISNLFKKGHFIKDDYVIQTKQEVSNYGKETLNLIDDEQVEHTYTVKPKRNKTIIVYADIECDVSGKVHTPILFGFTKQGDTLDDTHIMKRDEGETDNQFYTRCMNRLFRDTFKYSEVIVYFHNLKYDYSTLKKQIQVFINVCEKGSQLYSVSFIHNKKKFHFRDTQKFAPIALSKFQETFELGDDMNKKDGIAYRYYTVDNIDNRNVSVDEYETYLNDDEKKVFRSNIENPDNYTFRYRKDKKTGKMIFDAIEYYRYYLKYDTYILMKGMEKFEQMVNDITDGLNKKYNTNHKFNIHNYLTISSLTHDIMRAFGCYDGVYQICGNLREFCSKSAHGGRVQVNDNFRGVTLEGKIANLDAKSLYPSAIKRLCRERGLPKGKCQRIDTHDKKVLDGYDYYIVKIQITDIKKKQQLPMVRTVVSGTNQYINDIKKNIIVYVDMITLQDWVNFCDIEYNILDGVYWNGGYNKTLGEIADFLFDERVKHIEQNNTAIEQIIKLMLVSIYGKTQSQKVLKKQVIVDDERKEDYIANNFNNILSCKKLNDRQWSVQMDALDNTYNMCHVASFILSYSKRIMNEVYDIANTHNCPLYYSDTDSIHCNLEDIKTIQTEYKKKYNKVLIGKQLEQFDNDFKMDNATTEIYSSKSIFIAPKVYIDKMVSTDIDNNEISEYHYRLKGVNKQGMIHRANTYQNGDIFAVYENELASGLQTEFCLNPEGGKDCFEHTSNGVRTKTTGTYIVKVQF